MRSGVCEAKDIEAIDRRLSTDRIAQKKFSELWRRERGNRYGRLRDLILWFQKHQELIRTILGIGALFLDEAPVKPKKVGGQKTKRLIKDRLPEDLVLPPKVTTPKKEERADVEAHSRAKETEGKTEAEVDLGWPTSPEPRDGDGGVWKASDLNEVKDGEGE